MYSGSLPHSYYIPSSQSQEPEPPRTMPPVSTQQPLSLPVDYQELSPIAPSLESYNDPPIHLMQASGLSGVHKQRRAYHTLAQHSAPTNEMFGGLPQQTLPQAQQQSYVQQQPPSEYFQKQTQEHDQPPLLLLQNVSSNVQTTPNYGMNTPNVPGYSAIGGTIASYTSTTMPTTTMPNASPSRALSTTAVSLSGIPGGKSGIDPRQIPHPIPSFEADQHYYDRQPYHTGSPFVTPFSVTDFVAMDDSGHCNPKFLRPTTREIPTTEDLVNTSGLPLAVLCTPFASLREDEQGVPFIETGKNGPVRCERCKAYINPHCKFTDSGRKFICNLCKYENGVPPEYFCNLDLNGKRCDLSIRPELVFGSVDFSATKEYCLREPKAPVLLFLVEVTSMSIQSGLVYTATRAIRNFVAGAQAQGLPERVAIMTFDKSVHFYSFDLEGGRGPKMSVISDTEETFLPLSPSSLYLPLVPESVDRLIGLLEKIPGLFAATTQTLCGLGSGLELAAKTVEPNGGRIILFQASLPHYGPGSVAMREETSFIGTEKERELYAPQTEYYQMLGESFASKGISVDIYACSSQPYIDLATLGLVCSVTGGSIHLYSNFRPDKDENNLTRDLQWSLYTPYVFDSVTRVRLGNGLNVGEYYGNFNMKNVTDIEYARLDATQSFLFTLKLDGKLNNKDRIGCQVAILHTDRYGHRRIRVHNMNMASTNDPSNVFKLADLDTILGTLSRLAISNSYTFGLRLLRQFVLEKVVGLLVGYRRLCSLQSPSSQLILPETLKLLPIYTLALIKHRLLRDGRDIAIDKRIATMRTVKAATPSMFNVLLYPKLWLFVRKGLEDASTMDEKMIVGPNAYRYYQVMPLSANMLDPSGIYLLDNGLELILWIGSCVPETILQALFNVPSAELVPTQLGALSSLPTSLSKRLNAFIASLELKYWRHLPLTILRQKLDTGEAEFLSQLVDDRSLFGDDYLDWLCRLHQAIQNFFK